MTWYRMAPKQPWWRALDGWDYTVQCHHCGHHPGRNLLCGDGNPAVHLLRCKRCGGSLLTATPASTYYPPQYEGFLFLKDYDLKNKKSPYRDLRPAPKYGAAARPSSPERGG